MALARALEILLEEVKAKIEELRKIKQQIKRDLEKERKKRTNS